MDLQKNPSMKSCRVHSQVVAKADVGYRYATSGKVVSPAALCTAQSFVTCSMHLQSNTLFRVNPRMILCLYIQGLEGKSRLTTY